ncbi:unnamed protein product, partial [Urochloa humidicola]
MGDIACARSPPRRSGPRACRTRPKCVRRIASPLPLLLGSAAVPRLPRGDKGRARGTMASERALPVARRPDSQGPKTAERAQLAGAWIPGVRPTCFVGAIIH